MSVPIDVRHLSVRFGARTVLDNLNFSAAPGELVSLIGASGGGKTTLLRVLAGLQAPAGGEVQLPAPSRVRVMFQEDRLLPWLNVLDNVTLGLGRNAHDHAREVLAEVGLGDRERDYPAQLSGGQRQRVALARALAHRPDLLLLDEPFGALDALTRAGMHRLLERLWQELNFTAVLVTHDIDEALLLSDRVVVLEGGRIAQAAPVPAVRPRVRRDPLLLDLRETLEQHFSAHTTPLQPGSRSSISVATPANPSSR
ncbi:ABC transporter ATP-binding protein [Deinococcus sonorensis]|uniref:ABC transporter ATP-binding protein n=2 Tax=Deinococcus sonorensis TaxID=309891 RepID=A0AAU7UAN9_9DEIO